MDFILHQLKKEGKDTDAINIRTVSSMIDEWRTYNLLYTLGILRGKFKTIELNATQPWYSRILYTILSPFYFHFF